MYSYLESPMPVPLDVAAPILELPMAGVSCTQASLPADDFVVDRLDIMSLLVKHRRPHFFWRVRGDSMRDVGIEDGCIIVVDWAIRPKHGCIVLALVESECVKYLHQHGRSMKAARGKTPPIPTLFPKTIRALRFGASFAVA